MSLHSYDLPVKNCHYKNGRREKILKRQTDECVVVSLALLVSICNDTNLPNTDSFLTSISKIASSPLLCLCPLTKLTG